MTVYDFRQILRGAIKALIYMALLTATVVSVARADCVSLHNLRRSAQPIALYLWSPRMVSSVLEAPQARRAALRNGARFVPALSPHVPLSEALAALAQQPAARAALSPVRHACESSLPQHALDHAPTIFVVTRGAYHPHRIMGVMPLLAWQSAIAERLRARPVKGAAHARGPAPQMKQPHKTQHRKGGL